MPTIERDIVMQSKDENGNPTIDLPITRLGNVEDSAEIKEELSAGDYFPIIDSEDNGQMKKVKVGDISLPANGGNADTLGGKTASEFASSSHNHDSRYYTETEMNTKLAGKSNTGHTHTASEVSGLPTSLPANGGNADTVGGHTVNADVPANAKFTDTTYSNASTSAAGLVSTGAQTFAGNKTFNGQIIPNGASACGTLQARKMASGTAAANSTNCPSGAWYGQYE